MSPVKPTFENWKKFADGRHVVTIRYTPEDVYNLNFLYKSHRDYIMAQFKKMGIEITRYAHEYVPGSDVYNPLVKEWGLLFSTVGDRLAVQEMFEINAIIGVNARYTQETQLGGTARNEIQKESAQSPRILTTQPLVREGSDGGGAGDPGHDDLRERALVRVGAEDPSEQSN